MSSKFLSLISLAAAIGAMAGSAAGQSSRILYGVSDRHLRISRLEQLAGGILSSSNSVALSKAGARRIDADPTGRYLWVSHAGSNNGSVTTYRISADASTVTALQTLDFTQPANMVAFEPTGRFAYVASSLGNKGAITVYRMDPATGLATLVQRNTSVVPERIAMEPSGRGLVAITTDHRGAHFQIDFANTGAITSSGTPFQFSAPGSPGLVLDPSDIAAHHSGARFWFVAFQDRVVTHFGQDVYGNGGASVPVAAPSRVLAHPTGRFVFAASSTNQTIRSIRVDAQTNAWISTGSEVTAAPAADIALDPTGRFLYSTGNGTTAVYAVDPGTGDLKLKQVEYGQGNLVSLAVVFPRDRFLYSGRSNGTIIPARIDPAQGTLSGAGAVTGPLNLATLDPAIRFGVTRKSNGALETLVIDPEVNSLISGASYTPILGVSALTFDPMGHVLLTACASSVNCNHVTSHKVSTGGEITPVGILNAFLTQPDPNLNFSRIVFDPNGLWAYATQSKSDGGSRLSVISLNNATGQLGFVHTLDFTKEWVQDLAVDPLSQKLYVLLRASSHNSLILRRFDTNTSTSGGLFVPLAQAANYVQTFDCGACSWGRLATHPTGRFLFVVAGGGSNAAGRVYSWNTATAPLALIDSMVGPSPGLAGHVAADSTGRQLYVSMSDGSVSRVPIKGANGTLGVIENVLGAGNALTGLLASGPIQ